jgi:hypothetical protein
MKGFDFSPWGGIEGFLEASKTGQTGNATSLKKFVPDLAHAVDMTAVAISSLPFNVLDKNDDIYDTSENWKNNLGGLPNPQKLIYLIASSLCGGSAYLIPWRTTKLIVDLQYCAPGTITPQIDMNGLQWFDRTAQRGKAERIFPNKLIYFWLPDSDVEIGPAENHPLGNATLDAQVVWNMKNTMRMYGERGFVPITLLGAKGMVNQGEREKAEGFFDRLLRGGFNVLAKIVNSDALSLIRVGAGMDELKQSYIELRRDAKESIADSFGIPTALFMSDNAFASEFDALRKQWYTASRFVGIYQTIAETFSDQLFAKYGYKMRFNLEALEIFQEDESARATSLGSLVSSIADNPDVAQLGMSILGYDLDKAQQGQLEKLIAAKEEARQKVTEQIKPAGVEPEDAKQPEPKSLDLTADEIKDLALWYDRARQWYVKGKGTAVDWECKHLRETIAAPIRLRLADAQSETDIAAAFVVGETTTPAPVYQSGNTEAIKALALTIERAIIAAKVEPTGAHGRDEMQITINNPQSVDMTSKETVEAVKAMTANLAAMKQVVENPPPPNVTFAPVIQPSQVAFAPVIQPSEVINQNTINVAPTPIENNITNEVQPAPVTVIQKEGKRKAVVKDASGKVTRTIELEGK